MSCMAGTKRGCLKRCMKNREKDLSLFFCKKHFKKEWRMELIQTSLPSLIKLQSNIKGYLIRRKLQLHGFLIENKKLKKETYNNTEDLFTCETKYKPFDCFLLRENNKIFWFHIKTIIQWVTKFDTRPTNPYTRQPFTIRDSLRIKQIIFYNGIGGKVNLFHEYHTLDMKQYSIILLNMIVQYINDTLNDTYKVESPTILNLGTYETFLRCQKTFDIMKEFYSTSWDVNPLLYRHLNVFYNRVLIMMTQENREEIYRRAFLQFLAGIFSIFSLQKDNYAFSFIIGKHLL